MIEIEKQIIMSEKFPAMTYSLSNHLHFDGIIDYGNNILLGQAKDILHLDNYSDPDRHFAKNNHSADDDSNNNEDADVDLPR